MASWVFPHGEVSGDSVLWKAKQCLQLNYWKMSCVIVALWVNSSVYFQINHDFPGVLWNRMTFEDWCKNFTDVDICRIVNTSYFSIHKTWETKMLHGAWAKNSEPLLNRCGGCFDNTETFLQNPQVRVSTLHSLKYIHLTRVFEADREAVLHSSD